MRKSRKKKHHIDPQLESQINDLLAQAKTSTNQMVLDNAADLESRLEQFKSGKVGKSQLKETIETQIATTNAERQKVVVKLAEAGDPTPDLHETDFFLQLLGVALKAVL